MNKLVSVIIPVYNGEHFVDDCLDSILNNSYKELEIICINDGSTDSTGEILARYQNEYPNLIVIEQTNQGISAARNAGLQIAKGDYISFVDSDDDIANNYYEKLMLCFEKYDCSIAACGYYRNNPSSVTGKEVIDLDQYFQSGYLRKYVWGRIYKKTIVSNLFFNPDIHMGEDEAFNIDVIIRCINEGVPLSCVYIQDNLYHYRNNAESVSYLIEKRVWLDTCKWYLERAKKEENCRSKTLLIIEGIKKTLIARYEAQIRKQKHFFKSANDYLRNFSPLLLKSSEISFFKKLQYCSLIYLPGFYRQYRLIDDPSLRVYENNVKKGLEKNDR